MRRGMSTSDPRRDRRARGRAHAHPPARRARCAAARHLPDRPSARLALRRRRLPRLHPGADRRRAHRARDGGDPMRPQLIDDLLWRCYRAAQQLSDALGAAAGAERTVALRAAAMLCAMEAHMPALILAVDAIREHEREATERENAAAERT